MSDLDDAARAIDRGDLVVYPTETVYGLAADALDPAAIERVFETKGRSRENPISLASPDVATATEYVHPTDRERAFMREFLPGPVTVLCERSDRIPDVLVAGRDRVGIRIPDHDLALSLLDRVEPITATSANVSGSGSVTHLDDLDPSITDAAAAVLDDGETPGTESTVVDVETGEIHRPGALADEIETWLSEH